MTLFDRKPFLIVFQQEIDQELCKTEKGTKTQIFTQSNTDKETNLFLKGALMSGVGLLTSMLMTSVQIPAFVSAVPGGLQSAIEVYERRQTVAGAIGGLFCNSFVRRYVLLSEHIPRR